MDKSILVQKECGWTPVNPRDPHIISIAEFAVKEHNKTAYIKLVLLQVVRAWKQNVANGVNYKLTIEARNDKEFPFPPFSFRQYYEAIVYEDSFGHLQLISFAPLFHADGPPSDEVDAFLKLWKEMEDLKPTGENAAGEKIKVIGDSAWTIMNSKDPAVIEIGKFAVAEHNEKTGAKLEFVEVVSDLKLHILAFNFYALTIRTNDGVHKALVFEAPLGYKKLLFWMN